MVFCLGPAGFVPNISMIFGFSNVVDLAESFRMHWSRAFSTVNLSKYGRFSAPEKVTRFVPRGRIWETDFPGRCHIYVYIYIYTL